jgi:hypothetical protein
MRSEGDDFLKSVGSNKNNDNCFQNQIVSKINSFYKMTSCKENFGIPPQLSKSDCSSNS